MMRKKNVGVCDIIILCTEKWKNRECCDSTYGVLMDRKIAECFKCTTGILCTVLMDRKIVECYNSTYGVLMDRKIRGCCKVLYGVLMDREIVEYRDSIYCVLRDREIAECYKRTIWCPDG
jgi:hypothetical protein